MHRLLTAARPRNRWYLRVSMLVAVVCPQTAQAQINADGSTYDSHPSGVFTAAGARWLAWHAYRENHDQILARKVGADGKQSELFALSQQAAAVNGPPVVVAVGDAAMVFWSSESEGSWSLNARRWTGDAWEPPVLVSTSDQPLHPVAESVGGDSVLVAWTGLDEERFVIRCRLWSHGSWQSPVILSSGEWDAHRPAVGVREDGSAWVAWDEFDGSGYRIVGRQLLPQPGLPEVISPPGEHCLAPQILALDSGWTVAWLQKRDVVGGPGVISQWHTLHAARRRPQGWQLITDSRGHSAAAELTHGLMAKISPTPQPTGGYLGRRTAPMLAGIDGTPWLLWERKADHHGSTWRVHGQLLGRPILDGRWGDAVQLHDGLLDYRLVRGSGGDAPVTLLASSLPRNTRRIYRFLEISPDDARPLPTEPWEGWTPVQLPLAEQRTARREIVADGQKYRLFWADLHCHSGLTADAEGEPDELIHYARDRALLDVVVFTNNDFIYDVPLTRYEYALNNRYAGHYSRPEFLVLPGFEWTSRVPGDGAASVADPGNWTPPYQFRSYPNHRSVIYPPSGGPLLHYPEVANDIRALNRAVAEAGGITMTQHEAFLPTGDPVEVAMELTSGWRRYITRRTDQFHQPLLQGLRLGFVAAGDTHRRAPGLSGALTGIYAEALTSEAILEALRQRRCFATSGSRIALDARANGRLMGRDFGVSQSRVQLTLRASGTHAIARATLIRDGQELYTVTGDGSPELVAEYQDTALEPGVHWYYWRVEQTPEMPDLPGNLNPAFGHLAWSSPHWVRKP